MVELLEDIGALKGLDEIDEVMAGRRAVEVDRCNVVADKLLTEELVPADNIKGGAAGAEFNEIAGERECVVVGAP